MSNFVELEKIALSIRKDVLKMITKAGSGHPGGSLSAVEILTFLYFKEMRLDPQNPLWPERDRFILSKGHAAPALYAVLSYRGFFPQEQLFNLRQKGSPLQGHPVLASLPGIEMSSGSLGQGFAVAHGLALAARVKNKNYRVYTLLGDGESQEGLVWEAAMAASHYKTANLTAFLDYNGLQIDGALNKVMCIEPLALKWQAFGWHTLEINGHNYQEIADALQQAKEYKEGPTIIIAHTIKGKGVSFMENKAEWHGKAPKKEELDIALQDLS